MICLGDSFPMGYGVGDEDTFPALLEASSPDLEVVNMGLGGFGIDQEYLWYLRDGVRMEADLLLFFIVVDDFNRMVTTRFSGVFPKPIITLENNELVVGNVPVPHEFASRGSTRAERGLLSYLASELAVSKLLKRKRSSPNLGIKRNVTGRILTELRDLSRARDQDFAVVYLPMTPKLARSGDRVAIIQWLEQFTAENDVAYHDFTALFYGFTAPEVRELFAHDHYAPAGNQIVADALLEIVRDSRD